MEFIEVLKWIMLTVLGITFILSLLFVGQKPKVLTSEKKDSQTTARE